MCYGNKPGKLALLFASFSNLSIKQSDAEQIPLKPIPILPSNLSQRHQAFFGFHYHVGPESLS